MNDYKSVLFLILIMTVVALMAGGISIYTLYQTAFTEEEMRLMEIAQSQARLIEAVAQFDAVHSRQDHPEGATGATLSQIRHAHERYQGFGETGEFTLARREGDSIVFLLSHRHYDLDQPQPVPFDSELAEPMRRALSGQSGTVVGLDYRGERVLAAYEPVAGLELGIVAKIDLVELQAPFVKAGLTAILIGSLFIALGAILFVRATHPLLRQLREREERYRFLFNEAPSGISVLDLDGHFLDGNQSLQEMTGYSLEECRDTGLESLFVDPQEQTQLLEVVQDSGKVRDVEVRWKRKDASPLTALLNVNRIELHDQSLLFILARDITARKRAEEELKQYRDHLEELVEVRTKELTAAHEELQKTQLYLIQADKMTSLGELAAGVAHEISNPGGFVSGNLETLKEYIAVIRELLDCYREMERALQDASGDAPTDAIRRAAEIRQREDIDFILKDIADMMQESSEGMERIHKVVRSLGRFARRDSLELEVCNLRECIEETLHILENLLKDKGRVETQFAEMGPVQGHPGQLKQVLVNILSNAVQAIPDKGEIRVQTEATADCAVVRIADTGTGISPEVLPRIFDPFFTTRPVGQGTGLGLAISYRIIQDHHGTIEVDSQVGQGTQFTLNIPWKRGVTARESANNDPLRKHGGIDREKCQEAQSGTNHLSKVMCPS